VRVRRRTGDDGIRLRKVIRASVDRHTDPPGSNAAHSHGLSVARCTLSKILGSDGRGLLFLFCWKRKQLLDRHFELTSKLERHFRVGYIGSRLYGINGLPGNPHLFGKVSRANAPGLSNCGEISLYASHSFLNFGLDLLC
jgi:hypothetical protein